MSDEDDIRRHRGLLDDIRGGIAAFGIELLVMVAIGVFGMAAAAVIIALT
ncbi:MAG: hypothetical protein GXP36_11245 [Actinobacteria bacterium]|uniref:Uncharacterized protein n=1 Tax=hydrothermal vent metagenome TaxID=652676 RepID=A0A3B0SW76_9ZZZZ|nr:hypothetical protein [Actinomycetota bacterium]